MSVTIASYDAIQEVYDDAKWLKAGRLIEELTTEEDRIPSSSSEHLSPEQNAKFAKMIADVASAVDLDNKISTSSRKNRSEGDDGWILSTNADDVFVEYKSEPEISSHSFAISSLVDFSILNIVPIMFEADLLPDMMPKFIGLELSILEERGRFGRLIYQKVHLPPPFKNRFMVLDCQAIDAVEERGGFIIQARSEDPRERVLPPSSKGAVRMDVHWGGTLCRVTGPDSTDMCTIINVDAKLFGVPKSLVNFITRKIMWHAFKAFQKKALEFKIDGLPPQYAERVEQHRERIYDEIPRRFQKVIHVPTPIKIADVRKRDKKKGGKDKKKTQKGSDKK